MSALWNRSRGRLQEGLTARTNETPEPDPLRWPRLPSVCAAFSDEIPRIMNFGWPARAPGNWDRLLP